MGMSNLKKITEELIRHGRPSNTPTCIITRGTYPQQQIVTGTLADIVEKKEAAGLKPPGIIVIGEVVRFRETLLSPSES